MFRDAIRIFAEHVDAADVVSTAHEAPGMFHVYPILMPWADASREVYRELGEFVRERLTQASDAGQRRSTAEASDPRGS